MSPPSDAPRTALIGFGYAGKTIHAPLIQAAGLNLAAIVTSRPAEANSAYPDACAVPDFATVLEDPEIRLVVVAAPNDAHAPLAEAALLAGKAVVVDKPFTLTLQQALALRDLAQARGQLLSVFHNRRWDADFLTLKALMAEGALGEVVQFVSHFDRPRHVVRDRWREGDGPGAGIWYDLGPHLIDQALELFGWPDAIQCDLAALRPGGRSPDHAHAVLRYRNRRVVLNADMAVARPILRFAAHGLAASFVKTGMDVQESQLKDGMRPGDDGWGVDPEPGLIIDAATGVGRTVAGAPGAYQSYYAGVAEALRSGGPPPVTAAEATRVIAVLEAGLRSQDERREIPLDQALA